MLGDFGLATQLEQLCSKRNTQDSSLQFMPLEVYDGRTELKSDVWSLGITLNELAEGRDPSVGGSSFAVIGDMIPPPPSLLSSKWSAEFVGFVNKCLVEDVSKRWSVSELMNVSRFMS